MRAAACASCGNEAAHKAASSIDAMRVVKMLLNNMPPLLSCELQPLLADVHIDLQVEKKPEVELSDVLGLPSRVKILYPAGPPRFWPRLWRGLKEDENSLGQFPMQLDNGYNYGYNNAAIHKER